MIRVLSSRRSCAWGQTFPNFILSRYSVCILLDLDFGFHAYKLVYSQGKPVALDFSPTLRAYFVPDGFYVEGQVLTMPISSPSVLEVNIDTLPSEQSTYTITIEDNQAIIVDPNYTS